MMSYLFALQSCVDKELFIVGGANLKFLLNKDISDIDLCGELTPSQLQEVLQETPFAVEIVSENFGSAMIHFEGMTFQYTTLREEKFDKQTHYPSNVKFVNDISEDCNRRDFTINAIYYSLLKKDFVKNRAYTDFKSGKIDTIKDPDVSFSEDPIRMLRLVRLIVSTKFEPTERVANAVFNNANLVKAIAKKQLKREFEKLIWADIFCDEPFAHVDAMEILLRLGLLKQLLPELYDCVGVKQRPDYHKYDVYHHILETFKFAPPNLRIAAIFHDIAKPMIKLPNGSMKGHNIESSKVVENFLSNLDYSKSEIDRNVRLVKFHMYNMKCTETDDEIKKFMNDNKDILSDLMKFKQLDYNASGVLKGICPCIEIIQKLTEKI